MDNHTLIERLARYLAGDHPENWPDRVEAAASILALMKQPDSAMLEEGEVAVWERMIDAALRQRWNTALSATGGHCPDSADEEGEMPLTPDAVGHDRADWVHMHREKEKSS
jgi:hypothetical protein